MSAGQIVGCVLGTLLVFLIAPIVLLFSSMAELRRSWKKDGY